MSVMRDPPTDHDVIPALSLITAVQQNSNPTQQSELVTTVSTVSGAPVESIKQLFQQIRFMDVTKGKKSHVVNVFLKELFSSNHAAGGTASAHTVANIPLPALARQQAQSTSTTEPDLALDDLFQTPKTS